MVVAPDFNYLFYQMLDNIPQYSVSQISRLIKINLEENFSIVKITGEIVSLSRHSSGHWYFKLREEDSIINAICFKSINSNIKIDIENGLQVIATGKITSYGKSSYYQITVEKIELAGIGVILENLEKLKVKLTKEGLFNSENKIPLPKFPKKIGVITSPTGAVIEDIKHRILSRFPLHIQIYPVNVQGKEASIQIIEAIKYFNSKNKINQPDLLIIARGGGSVIDLAPFSDEDLVRVAFNSKIPIVSAIGHETDYSLLDLVADLRAPTPTAAAEIITPDKTELLNNINRSYLAISNITKQIIEKASKDLSRANIKELLIKNFKSKTQSFYLLANKYHKNYQHHLVAKQNSLVKYHNIKQWFLHRIEKKYSNNVKNISSVSFLQKVQLKHNKLLAVKLQTHYILMKNRALDSTTKDIEKAVKFYLEKRSYKLSNIKNIIKILHQSFKNNLERGYTLIKDTDNNIIKSYSQISVNQNLFAEIADAELMIKIIQINKKP